MQASQLRKHPTMPAKKAAPHFRAAAAVWLLQRASEEYLALPFEERHETAEDIFRSLGFNLELLEGALGDNGPMIFRDEWEPAWEAWLKTMPLPKGKARRFLTDEELDAREAEEQE
jgi:hypothetical protein